MDRTKVPSRRRQRSPNLYGALRLPRSVASAEPPLLPVIASARRAARPFRRLSDDMSAQGPREVPIGEAIRLVAESDPDRPALTHADAERTLTRMELERRTNRLARAYEEIGAGQDDLVTIALPNGVAFFESAIACWKLGATPQPVSAKLPPAELAAIIELANPPIVVGASAEGRTSVSIDFEPDPSLSDEPLLPDRIAAS